MEIQCKGQRMGISMNVNSRFRVGGILCVLLMLVSSMASAQKKFTQEALNEPNSEHDEQSPIITPDGKRLYFTVAGHPANVGGKKDLGDIWYSEWQGLKWGPAIHAGEVLNNDGYNAVIGFSHDGNRMYLGNHAQATTQGFSISHKRGDGWSPLEYIRFPDFKNRSPYSLGFFSATAEALVFSAEPFYGYGAKSGAEDIFVALLLNGEWQEPKNLGTTINTHRQEWAPSLSEDGKILYFSSNGRKGYGGFDIYFSERMDDTWENWATPVNMGAAINSEGRELNYRTMPASKLALYTSTRNSDGYGDIKVFSPPPNIHDSLKTAKIDSVVKIVEIVRDKPPTEDEKLFRVFGKVTNAKTGTAIPALIEFRSDTSFTVNAKRDGKYEVRFPSVKEYAVSVEAPGYIGNFEKLDVRTYEMNVLELNFKLQPIEVGATVNLKSVLFQQGTPNLLPESNEELDEVVEFLKLNPKVEIELSGHTDNRGVHEHNVKLSLKRVEVVKAYLVSKGISGRRIDGKGHGGSKPIADNKTEATRRLNRRVEFTIVKD